VKLLKWIFKIKHLLAKIVETPLSGVHQSSHSINKKDFKLLFAAAIAEQPKDHV